MTKQTKRTNQIIRLVMMALFTALAYATMFVINIKVSFLTFDAKDAVLTIGGLLFGPIAAAAMSFAVALIEMVTVSTTGIYGFVMNFLSSAAFAVTAAWIYKYKRDMIGATLGLGSAILTMTAAMMGFNLLVTPAYLHVDTSVVLGMIPTLLLPFNLLKAIANAAIVLVLYHPVSKAMKRIFGVDAEPTEKKNHWLQLTCIVIGVLMLAVAVTMMILLMNGSFSWGK